MPNLSPSKNLSPSATIPDRLRRWPPSDLCVSASLRESFRPAAGPAPPPFFPCPLRKNKDLRRQSVTPSEEQGTFCRPAMTSSEKPGDFATAGSPAPRRSAALPAENQAPREVETLDTTHLRLPESKVTSRSNEAGEDTAIGGTSSLENFKLDKAAPRSFCSDTTARFGNWGACAMGPVRRWTGSVLGGREFRGGANAISIGRFCGGRSCGGRLGGGRLRIRAAVLGRSGPVLLSVGHGSLDDPSGNGSSGKVPLVCCCGTTIREGGISGRMSSALLGINIGWEAG